MVCICLSMLLFIIKGPPEDFQYSQYLFCLFFSNTVNWEYQLYWYIESPTSVSSNWKDCRAPASFPLPSLQLRNSLLSLCQGTQIAHLLCFSSFSVVWHLLPDVQCTKSIFMHSACFLTTFFFAFPLLLFYFLGKGRWFRLHYSFSGPDRNLKLCIWFLIKNRST